MTVTLEELRVGIGSLGRGLRKGRLRAEAKVVRLPQAGDEGLQEGVELHAGRHGVH